MTHTPSTANTERPWSAAYRRYGIADQVPPTPYETVTALMEAAMQRHAERPAFRAFGQTLSYADVDRQSAAFAAWLQTRLGVKKGDRVAVMMPNFLAFPIAFLGIVRAGAVQVSVNPLYTPRELAHQLKDSGCEVLIIFSAATPTFAEIADSTPVRHVVTVLPGDGSSARLPGPPVDARLKDSVSFEQALTEGASLRHQPVTLSGEDLLFLQYTGGTTGFSKGAALSHRNLVSNVAQFKAFMSSATREGQEVLVTAIPLYHIFALMVNFITYFSIGSDNWLVANPREIDGFIDTLAQARPTVFMGVNTLYAGLVAHPRLREVDFSRLRLSGGGGAAVLPSTSQKWQQITGNFIREGYGLSETGPVLSFNPEAIESFSHSTGLPVPGTDILLLDADDQPVSGAGQAGEICATGPQIMSGYWQQAEANRAAFTADGYFRTGDIGYFDERGFLCIADRKKDMVLVSGFNVYPNEVEAVASALAGVLECACTGVPDDKTGEAVRLFVVQGPGANLTETQVIEHCRQGLAAYKVPRQVVFQDSLPKSTVGKIKEIPLVRC
ncbi:MAG: long-chain-fatty-acid--CoA ligase [Ideonella sp. MAG2]|nr:MAG: long-chain-fatty-acid--CoA ligase [Ideonella sp. MAG2]